MTDNLWGDLTGLDREGLKAPVAILKEQANILNSMTRGLIVAAVSTNSDYGDIGFTLFLRAPVLNNYTVEIVDISHDIGLYPVRVYPKLSGRDRPFVCDDEGAFKNALGQVLGGSEVASAVRGLVAQSKALG